jgi:hypothetical protein
MEMFMTRYNTGLAKAELERLAGIMEISGE